MDMDALLDAVEKRLETEQVHKSLFVQCSQGITRSSMSEVEQFPVDENGHLCWPAASRLAEVQTHISRFFEYDDAISNGRAQQMWPLYLEAAFPWMRGMPLADMLTALVVRTWYHRAGGRSKLQCIEYFCGKGNLTLAAVESGLNAAAMDKVVNQEHDVLEPHGLILALSLLAASAPGALQWLGSPCNSYTIMCRAQSMRSSENWYLGDQSKYFVAEGNCLGDLSALLILLGFLMLLRFGLEQPQNSVLPASGCMASVLRYAQAEKTLTYHYCFGGQTLKPLQLWSHAAFLRDLSRPKPFGCTQEEEALVTRNEAGFTGNKTQLKQSQAYSIQFGRAIIQAFLAHQN